MVSPEQSLVTGFKLIYRNKRIILILAVWELLRAAVVLFGAGLGGWWPVEPKFNVNFAMPRSWPGLDNILPIPITGPSLAHFSLPDLGQAPYSDYRSLIMVLGFTFISSYLKGGFLGLIKQAIAGNRLTWGMFMVNCNRFLNRFFIMELILLIAESYLYHYRIIFTSNVETVKVLLLICLATLVHLILIFTPVAVVFQDLSITNGVKKSWLAFKENGRVVITFALYGALINALIGIPLNWAIGTSVGLLASAAIFSVLGSGLSAGLFYLYSGLESFYREG